MSTGHIYILTDGSNTKIGITTSFDTRMASYKTHNATAQLFKQYQCPIDEAKRIESTIKSVFKANITGQGKEWFAVPAETIDRYVATLLEKPTKTTVTPGMHGVRLTATANELLARLDKQLSSQVKEERYKAPATKELMAEHFATAFGLGIPQHKLPDEHLVVFKEWPGVDIQHSASPDDSEKVWKGVRDNRITFPYDDHVWSFYHLLRLDTGHFIALCTSRVSMPYIKAVEAPEKVRDIVDTANEYGWYCTAHHEWSWHSPGNSALFLFQPKTPVQTRINAWEGSFRKWVIERQELLKLERYSVPEDLANRIEDIAGDKTFPLDVQSFEELCECYLGPCRNIRPGLEDNEWMEEPFRLLFEKWQKEK